jgi:hypothetical protein
MKQIVSLNANRIVSLPGHWEGEREGETMYGDIY